MEITRHAEMIVKKIEMLSIVQNNTEFHSFLLCNQEVQEIGIYCVLPYGCSIAFLLMGKRLAMSHHLGMFGTSAQEHACFLRCH